MRVGLEAIAFDVPQFYIELSDLALARGVDPLKYTQGLGQRQMAIATPCEDTVALAAEAALHALESFKVGAQDIGLVIVGTESSVDQSKPVAVYVHQLLGLPQDCRAFEVKHACYGAMAGVQMATDWILSGRARGKKALVIASDIARYGARTPGEPTQGAGAVALVVSDQPRILEFETGSQGYYSKQVMDFWRPNYSKEAVVDGHYSMHCYLDALAGAYQMFRETRAPVPESFIACLYHVPFVKMAQKAHIRFLEAERGSRFAENTPDFQSAQKNYAERVAPYLELNARVGNIYTGSLFLSLINLLDDLPVTGVGRSLSLFSYGSGCGAEWMSARVVDGAKVLTRRGSSRDVLDARTPLSMAQYEESLEAAGQGDVNGAQVCDPARWNLSRRVVYLGNKDHRRCYSIDGQLSIS